MRGSLPVECAAIKPANAAVGILIPEKEYPRAHFGSENESLNGLNS